MTNLFNWVKANKALAYLLSLLIVCGVFAVGYTIWQESEEIFDEPDQMEATATILTTEPFTELLRAELDVFNMENQKGLVKMQTATEAEILNDFMMHPEGKMMLLNRRFSHEEMMSMLAKDVALEQNIIAFVNDATTTDTLFIIYPQLHTTLQVKFASFLMGEKGQNIVLEKGFKAGANPKVKIG